MNRLKTINSSSLKKLFYYGKPYKWHIILIIVLSVISSMTTIIVGLFSKDMIDSATGSDIDRAIRYGIYTSLVFLGQVLMGLFLSIKTTKLDQSMRNYVQSSYIREIYQKSWLSISQFKTGDLLTRLTSDAASIVGIWVRTVPSVIALAANLIVAFIVLSSYDTTLAFLAFVVGPITVGFSWIVGRKMKVLTHQVQRAESTFRSYLNESLHNQILLKAFNYIPHNIDNLEHMQDHRRTIWIKRVKLQSYANVIMSIGYRFGFLAALTLGAYNLYLGAFSFGVFTLLLQLVSQVQGPMEGIIRSIPGIISTFASIERLEELEACDNEEALPETPNQYYTIDRFELSQIHFSYVPEKEILKDLNLTINRGEKIAILGNSGQGKTTILRLVMALIRPESGSAKIHLPDGEYVNISPATRRLFSYVPQKNILFSGSILNNLKLANPDVTEQDIQKAITTSCSDAFIKDLPQGLNSLIGEQVQGLSEGQIQRICIARALLHHTPILILDEATSALDMDTEDALVKNLVANYPDLTVISITHRRAILDISDKVYKLYDGQLHLI